MSYVIESESSHKEYEMIQRSELGAVSGKIGVGRVEGGSEIEATS